jgi:Protein of unknown function (DUF3551)
MRFLFAVPLLLLTAADPAAAQNYPWCAAGSFKDGARSCAYVSFEQCMATVRGSGSYCERNFAYQQDAARQPRRKTPRQH